MFQLGVELAPFYGYFKKIPRMIRSWADRPLATPVMRMENEREQLMRQRVDFPLKFTKMHILLHREVITQCIDIVMQMLRVYLRN